MREIKEVEALRQAAADLIRRRSEAGQLAAPGEILRELKEQNLLTFSADDQVEPPGALEAILKEAREENKDLKELPGEDGVPRYYSDQFMSETYARILSGKEGDPLQLIAEIVRENSALYPRPVPLHTFQDAPFGLTETELQACLEQMAGRDTYKDIGQTITSWGTAFLFSSLHLDPAHTSMLAEWYDVGRFHNT